MSQTHSSSNLPDCKDGEISIAEIQEALTTAKRNKAECPDGIECELRKVFDPATLKSIQRLFNDWFAGTEIDDEALTARVVTTQKTTPSKV